MSALEARMLKDIAELSKEMILIRVKDMEAEAGEVRFPRAVFYTYEHFCENKKQKGLKWVASTTALAKAMLIFCKRLQKCAGKASPPDEDVFVAALLAAAPMSRPGGPALSGAQKCMQHMGTRHEWPGRLFVGHLKIVVDFLVNAKWERNALRFNGAAVKAAIRNSLLLCEPDHRESILALVKNALDKVVSTTTADRKKESDDDDNLSSEE